MLMLTTCQHTYGVYVCSFGAAVRMMSECMYNIIPLPPRWSFLFQCSAAQVCRLFLLRLVVFQINILCFISCVLPRVVVPRVIYCFDVSV